MSDDFLANVKMEGTPVDELTETTSDSPPDTKPEADSPSEGDNTRDVDKFSDFRQHPRWQQREKELEELKAAREEDARQLAELASFRDDLYQELAKDSGEIPDFFTKLYGENPEAWRAYQDHESRMKEEITQQVIHDQETRVQQQAQESSYWEGWVKNQMDTLKADGHEFDENAFGAFMLEVMPTTIDNNLDFEKGIKLYEKLNPRNTASSEARKRLGDFATRSTSRESGKRDYLTPDDLRNKSWTDLAQGKV